MRMWNWSAWVFVLISTVWLRWSWIHFVSHSRQLFFSVHGILKTIHNKPLPLRLRCCKQIGQRNAITIGDAQCGYGLTVDGVVCLASLRHCSVWCPCRLRRRVALVKKGKKEKKKWYWTDNVDTHIRRHHDNAILEGTVRLLFSCVW